MKEKKKPEESGKELSCDTVKSLVVSCPLAWLWKLWEKDPEHCAVLSHSRSRCTRLFLLATLLLQVVGGYSAVLATINTALQVFHTRLEVWKRSLVWCEHCWPIQKTLANSYLLLLQCTVNWCCMEGSPGWGIKAILAWAVTTTQLCRWGFCISNY